jgi:hypothetical protein
VPFFDLIQFVPRCLLLHMLLRIANLTVTGNDD